MAKKVGGGKHRKHGRHDRGPSHHTAEQALRNKAKRVLQSSGAKAAIVYATANKLWAQLNGLKSFKINPRRLHNNLRRLRRQRRAA